MLHLEFIEYLRELNALSLAVRFLLAVLCGGAIGLEREKKQRPAGFRTHILVCVGSVMAMVIGQYLLARGYSTDISRIGAQVISGIGFLGAGTIIVTRHQQIKGLTTAAGLWASACIGLAIGSGFYEAALIGTVLILIIEIILIRISHSVFEGSKYVRLYIEFAMASDIGLFIKEMKQGGINIVNIEIDKTEEGQLSIAVVELEYRSKVNHTEILTNIRKLHGVNAVEEL